MSIRTSIFLVASLLWHSPMLWAVSVEGEVPTCASLLKFEGDVQILDSTRTNLIETNLNSSIPCGGWVSVRSGWVEIEHVSKARVRAASETFFLVQGSNHINERQAPEDLIVLYKGRLLVRAAGSSFYVGTANARAQVNHESGSALILYLPNQQETQLVALHESSKLLNRFEPKNSIEVKSGEATTLALNGTRVVPSTPSAIKAESLKPQLEGLGLESQTKSHFMALAESRLNRKIASSLLVKPKKLPSRNPANYTRYSKDLGDSKAESAWLSRLAGGESGAHFYPKQKKKQKANDPRKELYEELNQIRE